MHIYDMKMILLRHTWISRMSQILILGYILRQCYIISLLIFNSFTFKNKRAFFDMSWTILDIQDILPKIQLLVGLLFPHGHPWRRNWKIPDEFQLSFAGKFPISSSLAGPKYLNKCPYLSLEYWVCCYPLLRRVLDWTG